MRLKIFRAAHQACYLSTIGGFAAFGFQLPVAFSSKMEEKATIPKKINNGQSLSWLAEHSPEFSVCSKNIQILHEPSEFFEKLKELTRSASRRITLASLYFGTSSLDKELISCIDESLDKSNGELQVRILIDHTRGSRGRENSRTLLLPLLKDYPEQMEVSLYHTPNLRGWIKWLLPERWNETIGLTHLKVYLFDDTLILSGANLSDQYFWNRQDRYIVFYDCNELCNYFSEIVSVVSSMSFVLKPDNTISLHPNWNIHPWEGNYKEFIKRANNKINNLTHSTKDKLSRAARDEPKAFEKDTLIYPLIQMFTFGIRQDEEVMEKFLKSATPGSKIKLASGYFNLTNHYMDIILNSSKALYSLLVASPKVNSFYGASGVSGAIPAAYTHIAKKFFHKVMNYGQQNRIELREYERPSWTFHVKGLWYYEPGEDLPSVTFIGSPNFGYRSVYKDLEAQVAIVTRSKDLQQQLDDEQKRIYDRTTIIERELFDRPDRSVPLWVKLVTFVIRDYF